TQTPQPVQSSGATWMVMRWSARSLDRKGLDKNPSGAPASDSGAKTFMRMHACGQALAHLPQSIQISGSQIGISVAMALFSYWAVPEGKRPSAGKAETGNKSPLPAMILAVTWRTKSVAVPGTISIGGAATVASAGTTTGARCANAASTAAKLRSTMVLPRLPYAFSTEALTLPTASSVGNTLDRAKKHV